MKVQDFEHGGFNSATEVDQAQAARVCQYPEPVMPLRRTTDKPVGPDLDAQVIQLVAMFKASDERGRSLLLKIAGIHSTCYPKKA